LNTAGIDLNMMNRTFQEDIESFEKTVLGTNSYEFNKRKRSRSQEDTTTKKRRLNKEVKSQSPRKPNLVITAETVKSPEKLDDKEEDNNDSPTRIYLSSESQSPKKITLDVNFEDQRIKTPKKSKMGSLEHATTVNTPNKLLGSKISTERTPNKFYNQKMEFNSKPNFTSSEDKDGKEVPPSPIVRRSKPLTPRPNMRKDEEDCLIPLVDLQRVKADLLSKF